MATATLTRKPGRPKAASPLVRVSVQLDRGMLDALKARAQASGRSVPSLLRRILAGLEPVSD